MLDDELEVAAASAVTAWIDPRPKSKNTVVPTN